MYVPLSRRVLAWALRTAASTRSLAAVAAVGGALATAGSASVVAGCGRAASAADKTHDAVGTVQTVAPNGAYVIISHEDIPGYMQAMTMQFTAQSKDQLAGVAPGDRVAFSFTEKFVLTSIRKR